MRIVEFRPPRIALALLTIAGVIQLVFAGALVVLLSLPVLAFFLGSFGLGLVLWGWYLFRLGSIAIRPTAECERIIFSGPYRFSRNPIYLGMVMMLLGVALFIGTLPFYVAALLMFAILNFIFIPYEETRLESGVGEEFRIYKRQVRRWF